MARIDGQNELEQIHRNGKGLIYNDFAGPNGLTAKDENVLHLAGCPQVKRMTISVPKYYFETYDESIAWLERNRGREGIRWKRCGTCRPQSDRTAVKSAQSRAITSRSTKPARPFTEGEVEGLLTNWFQVHGYQVRRQVPVPSGFIDLVVTGRNTEWIIEVKGEDKGGYTSAQMNFQGGIGQLVSRMIDPSKEYALAVPSTEDYKKVIENYRDSFGVQRLGIYFLTIDRDGTVKRFEGSQINEMLESMDNHK